ncbi:MAG: WecB/TagA/CpsF family glycosyltransferase [Ruminococcaceae bacterium]|nr:WecB/TagA/CpsF family glycosyltransferase [Oscillospiraceae bacterium]
MAEHGIINVRGVDFDNVTKKEAVEIICSRLEKGEKTAVFTPNSEIVQTCIEDEKVLETIRFADMRLPDGIGVIKAASILKTPLKEKVAGVEVGEELLSSLADTGHSFFFFGGKPEENGEPSVAEAASKAVSEKYGCKVAGTRHGYFAKTGEENEETVRLINESGADVLYVCLGFPVQEKWIEDNFSKLENVKVVLGLGGSLDIYAGISRRAPDIFIKTGLEWLWRLLLQPSRFVRMLSLPKFYFGTLVYKMKKKS